MVSDMGIQRWISIGADPVHRLTLNGKAFQKKTFCPSSLCPGGLWPALSLRSSFLCLLALLAGCARSCGDGSGCGCASSSRGRFPKACVRYRRFCYRGRSCRHRRGPIRQLFVARVLCSCSSVRGQEGFACISCMLRLCSGTAFQNQCGPAVGRPVSQATRPRSAAAAPPAARKRVHACHVCCACVRANVCICLGRHRLCCRCRHHLQLFESVLVVCPSAVWFRTTFRKFHVIFPKVPRWFSKRFALFVSVSVWGLVGSISKSGDSLWTESHCLHRLQMLQMVLGARCPNGARKTQKQMKTKTGTTFFTLLYSEGTTFASSLLTNCFYFSFLFRCLQNKSQKLFANAAVRPPPPPKFKVEAATDISATSCEKKATSCKAVCCCTCQL